MGCNSVYGNFIIVTKTNQNSNFTKDAFYKTLSEESRRKAFCNEYDFDSPEAIDFDLLVHRLQDLKAGYATAFRYS